MRAFWSERANCSHNVSQKVKRIRRVSDFLTFFERGLAEFHSPMKPEPPFGKRRL